MLNMIVIFCTTYIVIRNLIRYLIYQSLTSFKKGEEGENKQAQIDK